MPLENTWYKIKNENNLFSPSLIVYPERIEYNINKMTETAGDVSRLRPHVKTHKMPEIIGMQLRHGIEKFKCATIAEAEMTASCGAADILLAMQPVGPAIGRFFSLKQAYPNINISCIADSEEILHQLSETAVRLNSGLDIWLDINTGMNRTGVSPGDEAIRLYRLAATLPNLKAAGLHAYDGHIHEKNFNIRKQICDESFAPVQKMKEDLTRDGFTDIKIVAGGSPTFPVHASRKEVQTSPGTVILWDFGYSSSFADLNYRQAAILFTRVVSKPARDIVCIDLGHKAVGSEMPQPRIMIPGIDDLSIIGHNEEHMVIKTSRAEKMKPGDSFYAIPWHICPTVDRYDRVYVAVNSEVSAQWKVEARSRQITF
jgi:D-serine deaminase-like pyridoxal phosphate-dependent protein